MLVYVVLAAGLSVTSWLAWRASRLGPIGAYAVGGVLSWGLSGLLYFLATRVVPDNYANLIEYVWIPLFAGYVFFVFLLGSLPRPKKSPVWLYGLTVFPLAVFLLAQPYTDHKTQLAILFALQLLLLYYALPLWYALAQGQAPEGRAIWIPVLIFFGSGITIWFALTPGYDDTSMVLAATAWLLGLWLLVAGIELETSGRLVSLAHLTSVAIGFMSMWMLALNELCLGGSTPRNLQLKLWLVVTASLVGGLSVFLPLHLFKKRTEMRLTRWGSILSHLTTFLWKQANPTPEGMAQELLQLFRRGCDNVAGVRLAVFDDLLVGEKTAYGLTLRDHDLVLGRVYIYDWQKCDGMLKTVIPLASRRLGEVIHSFNWRSQAKTDPLTNLLNRRGLEINLHYVFERVTHEERSVTVAMLDLDYFKQVNDRFGHAVGDALLQAVAKVLESNLRNEDLAVRWGGEEFLVLLTDSDLSQAEQIFERIRDRIAALQIRKLAEPVTVSVGLAGGRVPRSMDEIYEWILLADAALNRAKENGRNRIEKDY